MMCLFFLFKQKTAYEMRISDWSSDVCSSDLTQQATQQQATQQQARPAQQQLTPQQQAQLAKQNSDMSKAALQVMQMVDANQIGQIWDNASATMKRLVTRDD